MTEPQRNIRAWVDQSEEARELIFQALYLIRLRPRQLDHGIETSGNPRPLAGLSPDQLRGVNTQLEEMGIELRQTLEPEAQVAFEVSLDGAQTIVTEEIREKTLPASSAWTRS